MAYKRSRKDFEADLQKQESPFVLYGTALPPLDERSRDDGSYVPVWKQEVTDDRGRKRLHGAFTGGFSAGYYNTVGSKEGWAPSTFVSSRTNRAKDTRAQAAQRPEDFMDEEDIREQEETRHLAANEGFAGFGTADDASHKNTLIDLFKPTGDTIGTKLLNKMGWKQGHGIGPKVERKADPDDHSSQSHLFAPDDVPMLNFTKKQGHGGLGYAREGETETHAGQPASSRQRRSSAHSDEEEEEEEDRPGLKFASRSKKATKQKRGAFGVGIINDTGSDDEDPYSMGPRISYNKTLGGDKKSKRTKAVSSGNANPLLKNTPVFVSKKLSMMSATLRKCHDGRLPLDGFVLADELDGFSTMSLTDDTYKPPPVPAGWTPSRVSTADPSAETNPYQSTAEAARSSNHTHSMRGTLLGESALPGKSVFDYLTPAAREKLMKASGKINLPPALSESLPGARASSSQDLSSELPQLDPRTALQALSRIMNGGFTPYGDNPTKAARYKSYLESQANNQSVPSSPAPRPPTMTREDYTTELNEFARTAEVFKPVSGLIASRFTTSTSSSPAQSLDNATDGRTGNPSLTDLLTKPAERPKDPAEEAAKMNMFGPLTRTVSNFYPTRLLCKRFGVPMPNPAETRQTTSSYGGTTASGSGGASPPRSTGYSERERHDTDSRTDKTPTGRNEQLAIEGPPVGVPDTVPNVLVDPEKNEALEQEKPGAAVFRAIFGSDDEDED